MSDNLLDLLAFVVIAVGIWAVFGLLLRCVGMLLDRRQNNDHADPGESRVVWGRKKQ